MVWVFPHTGFYIGRGIVVGWVVGGWDSFKFALLCAGKPSSAESWGGRGTLGLGAFVRPKLKQKSFRRRGFWFFV
jgi:hypothetical protein